MSASGAENNNDKSNINGLAQLISSLNLQAPSTSQGGAKPLDARSAQALADKLQEILGDDGAGPAVKRNEQGQILNEEGLPVIEIAEAAGAGQRATSSRLIPQVTSHVPISSLSAAQKEARKREVDRILDELEKEEEEEERVRAAAAELEEAEQRKREKERARENMAKALAATNRLQSQQAARPAVPTKPPVAKVIPSPETTAPYPTLKRKPSKKVTFADDAKEPEPPEEPTNMGDVVMGRLRSKQVSASLAEQPMKLEVVERMPSAQSANAGAKAQIVEDSDDDSNFEEDGEGFFSIQAEDEEVESKGDEDDEEEDIEEEDEDGLESGEDFDTAMLQREAAAVYYSKRDDLRAGTGAFAGFGQIAIPSEGWEAEDVDDLGSSTGRKKTYNVSRFKSARAARSFLAPEVLPTGSAVRDKDLVGLVRQGNLDKDGELVVNEEDELQDEEGLGPRGHEMVEALRRGEIPVAAEHTAPTSTSMASPSARVEEPMTTGQPKVSRFKAARQATPGGEMPPPSSIGLPAQEPQRRTALSSAVMERSTNSAPSAQEGIPTDTGSAAAPAKVSRFKARRAGQ